MQIIKQTEFHSDLLTHWMKQETSIRVLLTTVMRKLSIHMRAAKDGKVYSFTYLWQAQEILMHCQRLIDTQSKKYQQILRTKAPNLLKRTKTSSPLTVKHEIGSPIMYQMINTLEKVDDAFYFLGLCRLGGFFQYQGPYQADIAQIKGLFFNTLTTLTQEIPLNPPVVSIADYLEDHRNYRAARKQHGLILPEILFNVLQSSLLPPRPPLEFEKLVEALKQKAAAPKEAIPAIKKRNSAQKPETLKAVTPQAQPATSELSPQAAEPAIS